jgi:hypothetical protein
MLSNPSISLYQQTNFSLEDMSVLGHAVGDVPLSFDWIALVLGPARRDQRSNDSLAANNFIDISQFPTSKPL